MRIGRELIATVARIALLAALLGLGFDLSSGIPAALAADGQPAKSISLVHLPELLVAVRETSEMEDAALRQALAAYNRRSKLDDFNSLTGFVGEHPRSGWNPAILTNLGLLYLHYGHFSKALQSWEQAWQGGRSATDPQARALVDRAVGELLRLEAAIGRFDRVAALFAEIGDRPITGSATELVQIAREDLALVDKDPRHLFNCGPLALQSLMLATGVTEEKAGFLQWQDVGPKGTSLAELGALARKSGFDHRLVFRKPGQKVPVPSVVHWKVGHFSAILGEANGRYEVRDWLSQGRGTWVTADALDSEATGYFLVSAAKAASGMPWRIVAAEEAATIWGKGPTSGTRPGDDNDPTAHGDKKCPSGMCAYDIKESTVGLTISDQPVGYEPTIGPSARLRITYNQREDSQPATFSFFNLSPKWTVNWLSYVTDDPANPGANVTRYLPGGGSYAYAGYVGSTGRFSSQTDDGSILVRSAATPITYKRLLGDGSLEVYSQSDGSSSFPRKVFLTQVIDPQGNALTLSYDAQLRLTTVTDAVGRQTSLSYGLAGRPLLVTQVTDPFGRSATIAYDSSGRLSSITDTIGLTSSVTYDANSLVNSMTTPYGTTTFAYTAPGTSAPPRFVQVTDPLGFSEREEWLEPSSNPASDPAATVPTGMPIALINDYLQYRNSFHWDKNAYLAAGCTPTGGCDYSKARIRHFHHVPYMSVKDTSIESVKQPLENRVWYAYFGQANSVYSGTFAQPTAAGRVLDDGTTQLWQFAYDTSGFFKPTQIVDPVGRTTYFSYSNQVDLAAISQVTDPGFATTVAQYVYNLQHRPIEYYDAALQETTFGYNAKGQPTSVTNPLNQTTQYQYDAAFNLGTVINANNQTAATYTYDSYARVRTFTDSEGWTVTYDYDAADRITKKTYPDGTFETYVYDKLDLVSYTDREGRQWSYAYDADRRLTSLTDPQGEVTRYGYNRNGQISSLTDPKTNVTQWTYDIEGRLTSKQYPDTSTVTYTYETTTSRLKAVTDALSQVKTYAYAKDDRLSGITYTGAVNPTPNVSFTWDPYFPRLTA
ncbi:MAG: peptidase C39, partial [Proteobacteria bacterium]|nr:peptidase C39 [Pseudomonadota bacterium]